MALYKAQAEIALQDNASGAFATMANKMRQSATKLHSGITGIFTKMKNVVSNMLRTMGRSITAFLPILGGAGLALAFRGVIREASNFSDEIAKVSTMLSTKTIGHIGTYKSALGKMAVTFGRTTKDLSDGLYNILSAGVPADKALSHLETTIRSAVGGFAPLGEVARAVSAIMQGYKKDNMDAARATDILAAIVEDGITTLGELAPSIGMVTAMASDMGIKMEELAGAIATVSKTGVGTSITMTSVRALLTSLKKPPEEAAGAMKVLNDAMKRGGLVEFARVLKAANFSAEEMIKLFPNVRAAIALGAMKNDTEGLAASIDKATHSAGMAERKFKQMTDTPAFRLAQMRQEIAKVQRTIGEALLPGLQSALDVISKLIGTNWIQDGMKAIGKTIGDVLANIMKIIGVLGMGIEKYGSLLDFITKSTDATWQYLNSKIMDLSVIVVKILQTTITTVNSLVFAMIGGMFRSLGEMIKSYAPTGFKWIGSAISEAGKIIASGAKTALGWANDIINNGLEFWKGEAKSMREKALNSGEEFLREIEGKATKTINKVADKVKSTGKHLWTFLERWVGGLSGEDYLQKFGQRGWGTQALPDFLMGPERGRRQRWRDKKYPSGPVEELMMGALSSPQMIGQFGIRHGGILAAKRARFIRQFGKEEGLKKFAEEMQRQEQLAPGVGFFRDLTPSARQRMRQQAIQEAMIRQKPLQFAQRIAGKMGDLQGKLTDAILSGDTKRIGAIQKRMEQLGAARERVAPGLKSQLEHLKNLSEKMKNAGKEVPEKISGKIKELEEALGETAKSEKDGLMNKLEQKARDAASRAAPKVKGYVTQNVVQPIVNALKKVKVSAKATAIANGGGVTEEQTVTPDFSQVPSTYQEPHTFGSAAAGGLV